MRTNLFVLFAIAMMLPATALAQPSNDNCVNAMPIANHSVTAFDMTGATRDGTFTASCNGSSSRIDLFYSYTASAAEQVMVSLCGSPEGTRRILSARAGSCTGTEVACDENSYCGIQVPVIDFETPGAGIYIICVSIRGTPGPLTGTLHLDAMPAVLPGSDLCSGATDVFDGTNYVRNTGASQDTQVPCVAGGDPGNSGVDVWYSYTAPETGVRNFEITTFPRIMPGSINGDTILAIYDSCGGTLLACDDDGGFMYLTKIYHFPIVAGTTYKIRFSGWGNPGSFGLGTFVIAPPPVPTSALDDCSTAVPVSGQGVTAPFATAGLTTDIRVWDAVEGISDGWFAWTPSVSGIGKLSTCGLITSPTYTGYNSTCLSLYGSCDSPPLAAHDDFRLTPTDTTCPPQSTVCYPVVAGTTYRVRIGKLFPYYPDLIGSVSFDVLPPASYTPPPNAVAEPGICGDDPADPDGGCDRNYTFVHLNLCDVIQGTCSTPWLDNLAINWFDSTQHDTDWYEFTLATSDTITVTGQSQFFPLLSLYLPDCGWIGSPTAYYRPNPDCTGVYNFAWSTALSAGTYWLRVYPEPYNQIARPCGASGVNYWLALSGATYTCRGDFDNSGTVDVADVPGMVEALMAGGSCPVPVACCKGDLNADGVVDGTDIAGFVDKVLGGGACP